MALKVKNLDFGIFQVAWPLLVLGLVIIADMIPVRIEREILRICDGVVKLRRLKEKSGDLIFEWMIATPPG
jgi:hypothetical protein